MGTQSQEAYRIWSEDPYFDARTRAELAAIAADPLEIEDRFYKHLEFGTGGLRGILGAGTNRMNRYTVARATTGFARYIVSEGEEAMRRGVAISYDCRIGSPEFAEIAALVFASHGIHVYLFDELRPTPMLSFAVRRYNCFGGVMVTASHNPKQYNGYKAYGEDGGQMPPEAADVVLAEMNKVADIRTLSWISREEAIERGLVEIVGPDIDDAYNEMLLELCIDPEVIRRQKDIGIVYTPLHGCGNRPVRRVLASLGFENVHVVPEQELPDGNFPTVKSPNPEERSALAMGLDLAEKVGAELVIATDPDGDRTGLAVRLADGEWSVLTGNQIGLLLMEYILSAKERAGQLPDNSFAVTTIVSTKLGRRVAAAYDVRLFEVLTGFKYIGEKIKELDDTGLGHYQFGFEESYGYLAGTSVRDKDAVVASMLLAEMAAFARDRGQTMADLLENLYARYGYGLEETLSLAREGIQGTRAIQRAMANLREIRSEGIEGLPVSAIADYVAGDRYDLETGTTEELTLPSSNVLYYELKGDDWICVRPSGTEPKIKVYFGAYGDDRDDVDRRLATMRDKFLGRLEAELDG
ncbi:MAG: phospho-sugar mutase [Bacillota bacterium]|nr:phospho-sugar mutase [Bacillota bacterium]